MISRRNSSWRNTSWPKNAWRGGGMAAMTLMAAACSGVLTDRAVAQEPPAGFTWYVLNEINGFSFDIDDPTNRPPLLTEVPEGVLIPVDVSKDGVTDWLIQWPEETQFCGTGGCQRSLYVSDDGGYVRAFDRQAWDLEIKPVGAEIRLEASFHHLNCSPQRETCRLAWAWEPKSRSLVERPSADGARIIGGFGEAAVDLGDKDGVPALPDTLPSVLYDLHKAGRRNCPSLDDPNDLNIFYPTVADIPDLNGDGVRDWAIEAPGSCGGQPPATYGYQIWISDGQGGATLAFTSAAERWPRLDVGVTPAVLLDGPGCGEGENCPTTPLAWDAASRTLKPPR